MPEEAKKYKLPWEIPNEVSEDSKSGESHQPIIVEKTVVPTPSSLTKKSNSKTKIIIIVTIVVALLIVGAGVIGFLVFQGIQEASHVQQKITIFLKHTSKGDFESAYQLTSTEFKQTTTFVDFKSDITSLPGHYSDFENLEQTGFYIEAKSGQPTVYQFSGIITYINGDEGDVETTLIKEDGEYRIQNMYVTR